MIDEFGKFLEYSSKNDLDEMFFFQELAEFCNSEEHDTILITTLHQNYSSYAKGLSHSQKSEWDKVKGRFLELAFDEPVEQLLFFAAQKLSQILLPEELVNSFEKLINALKKCKLISKNNDKTTYQELFPLDPLSADILTKSLQRYGQNERSLFSFLESSELEVKKLSKKFFSVSDCFDYLINNLSQEIQDGEKNPFKPQWKAAIIALEKAEFLFEDNYEKAADILKTICLVNIFSGQSGELNDSILEVYLKVVLDIENPKFYLDKLCNSGIIKYSNYRNKYNFIEGTDVDIETELINATRFIEHDFSISSRLKQFLELGIIPAKKIQFEVGTPRLFEFKFVDNLEIQEAHGEIDGHINLLFSNQLKKDAVVEFSNNASPNQIFVLFDNIDKIKNTLIEIDKIDYTINKYSSDKVAKRILNEEKQFRYRLLEALVSKALFANNKSVLWIWNGDEIDITSTKIFNRFLSKVSKISYPETPTYINEMVNKEYLSSPILTARKALLKRMIKYGEKENLGFDQKKYPPQKTIYLSLLKNTGIHRKESSIWGYYEPKENSFKSLWNKSIDFIKSSQNSSLSIDKFYEQLKGEEIKLKQGFLDFWIPIILIIKKEDYSLYHENGEYIPHLSHDVLDLIYKSPKKFKIKGLSDNGINSNYLNFYKELTGFNDSNVKGLESSYITIYSNFLKFYRGLPDFSKKTNQLSKEVIEVRNAISTAKDPENALFDKIPAALGYHNIQENNQLKNFVSDLKNAIRSLRTVYEELVDNIYCQITSYFDKDFKSFSDYKKFILNQFESIKPDSIVDSKLKLFHSRLISKMDMKTPYIEGLIDVILGKRLDKVQDQDLTIINQRLIGNFETLISLIDIHKLKVESSEQVYNLKIITKDADVNLNSNLIISKNKNQEIEKLQDEISAILGVDSNVNRVALIKLLEKELKNNE